ncbi:MAG: ribonuclease III [Firmicutes bacterium]|nr:ribonuclease III [Bacillota bacterium]
MSFNTCMENLRRVLNIDWERISLLQEALTHSSYAYENKGKANIKHNERLEFLGDAVLELIISEHLFLLCPDKPEGELTKMRARIVCEPSLASVARKLDLGRSMFMGRGEERSGGRKRPSILADVFEALLGALYLDKGFHLARDFALRELDEVLQGVLSGTYGRDFKTELQEYLQQRYSEPVKYQLVRAEGPDHDKTFTVTVSHRGKILGEGQGHSKKEAEQEAARMALNVLEKE